MTIKDMRNKRASLIESARAMYNTMENENRSLSDEESRRFDAIMSEADGIAANIARVETLEEQERALDASQGRRTETRVATATDSEVRKYLSGDVNLPQGLSFELRAQTVGTDTSGGFTVADEPMAALEAALQSFGGMRQVAKVLRTSTGADLPMPLMDDTANGASIIGENTSLGSGPDLVFSQVVLKAYKYSSGIILLPWELITDSSINIGQVVGDALGTRLGRTQNAHFSVGTGTAQPQGVTAAPVGVTGTTLGAVDYEELVDLIHSVDAAYRANAVMMMNDQTLAVIRKIVDTTGRPLFWSDAASLASGVEGTILGYRYVINNDLPALGTANGKTILFGDFKRGYTVRDVQNVQIVRLSERYADTGQVAFVGIARSDGRLTDAGGNPIKAFQNAAA